MNLHKLCASLSYHVLAHSLIHLRTHLYTHPTQHNAAARHLLVQALLRTVGAGQAGHINMIFNDFLGFRLSLAYLSILFICLSSAL